MMKKYIIWDWNGTLLNDVQYSIDTINILLEKYKLPTIDIETYRKKFIFPVKNYYKNIGFDFQKIPFEKVGLEFIELYNKNLHKCKLQDFAIETLEFFKKPNIKQALISAREQNSLLKDIENYGIANYFDTIAGIDNNFANGKIQLFDNFLKQHSGFEFFLIGDTTHDCKIAKKFGINFILFKNGHQSIEHFRDCEFKFMTVNSLKEIPKKINLL